MTNVLKRFKCKFCDTWFVIMRTDNNKTLVPVEVKEGETYTDDMFYDVKLHNSHLKNCEDRAQDWQKMKDRYLAFPDLRFDMNKAEPELLQTNDGKPIKLFTIREPIWKEPRSVGLNRNEIENATEEIIAVKIVYRMRKKNDELLYPEPFYINRDDALKYPIQKLTAGIRVVLIPIQSMRDRP